MVERIVAACLDAAREIAKGAKLSSQPGSVVMACAEEWGASVRDIMSRRRAGRVVEARQVAMYIMRTRLAMLLTETASFFSKDHSTVSYAVDVINDRRRLSPAFQDRVNRVIGRIDFG